MKEERLKRAGSGTGWLAWLICVTGWLLCAVFCLWLILALETYPYAYDVFFPIILLILFCNIFLFLFIAMRWAMSFPKLYGSVLRLCAGEAIILAGMYGLGRYCM